MPVLYDRSRAHFFCLHGWTWSVECGLLLGTWSLGISCDGTLKTKNVIQYYYFTCKSRRKEAWDGCFGSTETSLRKRCSIVEFADCRKRPIRPIGRRKTDIIRKGTLDSPMRRCDHCDIAMAHQSGFHRWERDTRHQADFLDASYLSSNLNHPSKNKAKTKAKEAKTRGG